MIFILDRFTPSAFGLSTAVREFASVTTTPRLSAREIDPNMLRNSGLCSVRFWGVLFGRERVWHIDDMFAPYCLIMSILGLLTCRQVVICPHGMLDHWAINNGRTHFKKVSLWILNKLAIFGRLHIHALTPNEAEAADHFIPHARRVEVIPNGVPSDILDVRKSFASTATRTGPLIIGCMSRISPKKNQLAVVELAIMARDFRPDLFERIEFRIDGQIEDSGYATLLRNKIVTEGLSDKVIIGGNVPFDERAACLAGYDLFFFPSKSEGMPYVVLEAMALGTLPLVSSESMCDFIKPFGGKIYNSLDQALKYIPNDRKTLDENNLHVDAFLDKFGKTKLRRFMESFSDENAA